MVYLENQVDSTFNNPTHGKVLRATQLVLEEAFAIAKGLSHPLTLHKKEQIQARAYALKQP